MRPVKYLSLTAAAALTAAVAVPVIANSLVAPGPRPGIAKSTLSAKPTGEWNKLGPRYDGKNVEIWTLDGDALNKVTFYGGIVTGSPLLREVDAKNTPLPKVAGGMIMTDIPGLLESTYRSQHAVDQMAIDVQEPATFGTFKAIRFTYTFTRSDDQVLRKGEAIGTFANGKLYLVTYEAPALYYFDKDVEKYRQLVTTLAI